MNLELTAEQAKLQSEAKEFVENEVVPNAAEDDRLERLNAGIVKKLGEKGYLGSMIPEEFGGSGLDAVSSGILNEEIGKGCSSVRSLLTVHGMAALAIHRWGTGEQKDYWLTKMAKGDVVGAFGLTEPNVGSDAKSIETIAVKSEGNFVLNGTKRWITMGQIADVFLIFAQLDEKPTAFIIKRDTPGLYIKPINGLIGARASMIAELKLENCVIPEENLVGNAGTGISHVALSSLDYGRYTIAWGCVGLAQACLEASLRYTRKRKQFGVPLRQHQLIQRMITNMVVDIKAARLLCLNAGYLKDSLDPDSILETWNAKYFASKMVNRVAADAVQIHGAVGCNNEYPIERYYRDAKINEIIEGTSQMHEVLIATNAFRRS